MKTSRKLLLLVLLVSVLSGCKTLDFSSTGPLEKIDKAIGRNQVRIKDFFARLFMAETESVNFAVRIRHEFFVYFPPVDQKEEGFTKLSHQIQSNLFQSEVDNILNRKLEQQAKKEGTKDIDYLEINDYRVFIEPRFISFEYSEGIPPVLATLKKGKYALSMQSQIIIRDKHVGNEVWRQTVTVRNDKDQRILNDFSNTKKFKTDIDNLAYATAQKIFYILKSERPIQPSPQQLAAAIK